MDPAVLKKILQIALPALLAGVALFLAGWWRKRERGAALDALCPISVNTTAGEPLWLAPVGLGVLAIVLIQVVAERFTHVPTSGADWLVYVALSAMLLGAVAKLLRVGQGPRWVVRGLVLLAAGYVVLRQPILNRFSAGQTALWLGGFVTAGAATLWAVERHLHRARGVAGPALVMIFTGAASQLLVLGFASTSLGQIASIFAAAMVGACAIAVLRPRFNLSFGGAEVPVLVTAATLVLGLFSASLDEGSSKPFLWAGLLLLSPLVALLADLPAVVRRTGPTHRWPNTLVRLALAAIPAGAGVGGAALTYQFPEPLDDPYALAAPAAPPGAPA